MTEDDAREGVVATTPSFAAWGPFVPSLTADERKAQLRSLRALVRVLAGPRGDAAELAILRAEISGGDEALLDEVAGELDKLGTVDRLRVISSFAASLPPSRVAG